MSTARVDFTRGAAERIAAVVRAVEQGERDGAPLNFRRVGDDGFGGGVRRGTFTGPWGIGETRVVTLLDGSATASVTNYCVDSVGGDSSTPRSVLFSRVRGTNAVVEISRGPSFCGTFKGPDLISLSFESCYGSGAAGRVTAPGGVSPDDAGPIAVTEVTSPGSGYALKARIEPSIIITGSGTGATFSSSLTTATDGCGVPYWKIDSATVTGGGGYKDGQTLTITTATGSIVELPATLIINTVRSAPTLEASAAGGSGAVLSVAVTQNAGVPETWRVSGISVTKGGTGYPDGADVTIIPGSDDVEQNKASASARSARTQPTVAVSANVGGAGAELSATLTKTTDGQGLDVWAVSGFSITNGGAGYSVSNPISVAVTDGVEQQGALGSVGSVHTASGEILTATVVQAGQFYKTTGVLESVVVNDGGQYYKETPDSITVADGGRYYKEDASLTPYTTPIAVTISQISPSAGSGASLSAVVDTNTASPTFGQITSVTIGNGGDNYLAWEEKKSLLEQGIEFADVTGFDVGKIQVLGHGASACLQWFDITTCGTATSSP